MLLQEMDRFKQLPDRVKKCVRRSLRMTTRRTDLERMRIGQSRIGGNPDVPPGFQWPVYEGLPLSFIAQLDLAELAQFPEVLPLPKTGSLAFFYDSEQPWGFHPEHKGSAVVAYFPETAGPLQRLPPPAEMDFGCCSLDFCLDENLPNPEWLHYDPPLSTIESNMLYEFLHTIQQESDGPLHRIGGHPDCVQDSMMDLQCELIANGLDFDSAFGPHGDPRTSPFMKPAKDWTLLLQLDSDMDSDEGAAMLWGDYGRIYYWIRKQDLAESRFDRTWLILQCS